MNKIISGLEFQKYESKIFMSSEEHKIETNIVEMLGL
jgi:hypothetical protein